MSNHILTQDGKWVTISDDELYHWKYIKREKVNGTWRYYYDVDNNKITAKTTSKNTETHNVLGADINTYTITTSSKNDTKTRIVSKDTYNKTKTGTRLYIGDKLLKDVAKDQITVGASYLKDRITGKTGPISDKVVKAKSWVSGLFSKKKNK